jgi:hypothetical protein
MAEITRHKSCRGEDARADKVANEHAGGGEPADAARKQGRIVLGSVHRCGSSLFLSGSNQRHKPHEGESVSLITLRCPVIEL